MCHYVVELMYLGVCLCCVFMLCVYVFICIKHLFVYVRNYLFYVQL